MHLWLSSASRKLLEFFRLEMVAYFPVHFWCTAVASLWWVTLGAATEGVTPLFFSWKTWRPSLVASSTVSPLGRLNAPVTPERKKIMWANLRRVVDKWGRTNKKVRGDTLEGGDTRVKAIKSDSDRDSDEQKRSHVFQEKIEGWHPVIVSCMYNVL